MAQNPTRLKGRTRVASPEKMDIVTSGIEMTRGTRVKPAAERLTSGQEVADESDVAKLVINFILNDYGRK